METDKIIQELRKDYRTAEEWLIFYRERKEQYYDDMRYIRDESPSFDFHKAIASGSSWTEYKAIQIFNLENDEKWILTVEIIQEMLSDKKAVFLEMRRRAARKNKTLYDQGKPKVNWIMFVQEHYANFMAKQYHTPKEKFWLSENTIKAWWKEIVNTTRLIALKKKCKF